MIKTQMEYITELLEALIDRYKELNILDLSKTSKGYHIEVLVPDYKNGETTIKIDCYDNVYKITIGNSISSTCKNVRSTTKIFFYIDQLYNLLNNERIIDNVLFKDVISSLKSI